MNFLLSLLIAVVIVSITTLDLWIKIILDQNNYKIKWYSGFPLGFSKISEVIKKEPNIKLREKYQNIRIWFIVCAIFLIVLLPLTVLFAL